jgi:hypothetical protein
LDVVSTRHSRIPAKKLVWHFTSSRSALVVIGAKVTRLNGSRSTVQGEAFSLGLGQRLVALLIDHQCQADRLDRVVDAC